MTQYVAFLRGINVAGNTRVSMADLKKLFSEIGFEDIQTYLNSGNVLFKSEKTDSRKLTPLVEDAIKNMTGFKVRVMLKTKQDLEVARDSNPFSQEKIESARTLFVSFLFEPLPDEKQEEINALSNPQELLKAYDDKVYTLLVRAHFSDSAMGKSVLLKKFKVDSTARNWNTLTNVLARMN